MLTPPPAAVAASPMELDQPRCMAAGQCVRAAAVCPATAIRLVQR